MAEATKKRKAEEKKAEKKFQRAVDLDSFRRDKGPIAEWRREFRERKVRFTRAKTAELDYLQRAVYAAETRLGEAARRGDQEEVKKILELIEAYRDMIDRKKLGGEGRRRRRRPQRGGRRLAGTVSYGQLEY